MDGITSDKVFEIIAVYFVNCYWNDLHKAAQDSFMEEQSDSLSEAYKTAVERYQKAFCKPDTQEQGPNQHYKKIIMNLYQNYIVFTNSSDTFMGFVDVVSKYLMPKDYYRQLARQDPKKDTIFRQVLTKAVTKFTIYILQEEVPKVTNKANRTNKKMVQEWKNKFVTLLLAERNEFCSFVMASNSGVDLRSANSIPKEAFDRLQQEIGTLIKEKSDVIKERNQYAKFALELKKIVSTKEKQIEEMKSRMAVLEQNQYRPRFQRQPPYTGSLGPNNISLSVPNTSSTVSPISMVPVVIPESSDNNGALQELENQEYESTDPVLPTERQAVEETVDFSSEGQLQADE
jgi:hypothetical protein